MNGKEIELVLMGLGRWRIGAGTARDCFSKLRKSGFSTKIRFECGDRRLVEC